MAIETASAFQHLNSIAHATGNTFIELQDEGQTIVVGSYSSVGAIPGFVHVSFFEGTDTINTPPKNSFIVTPDNVGRVFGHDFGRPRVADIVAHRVDNAWRRTHAEE